ncbi:uncharacterized protein [Eurosta solidaginis]|uniref:uncharacterized protein n=1 Tax=Eurosta solidaginis TaxID=178769 RepID=UPI0035313D06
MLFFKGPNTHSPSRRQSTTNCLTLLISALLLGHSHFSNATDYDSDVGGGVNLGPSVNSGGGGVGDIMSANDEIYETAVLQQDMDEHEKYRRMMEEIEEDKENDHTAPTVTPEQNEMSNESINMIRPQARIDDMNSKDSLKERDQLHLALPAVTTMPNTIPNTLIPAYVRKAKAEHFPRTITGGSVSVEEADANISIFDYVDEDDDHTNARAPTEKIKKINPIAKELYQQVFIEEDNTLKAQQPAPPPPAERNQSMPAAQQQPQATQHNNPLHANNSGEDYYDDYQDSSSSETQHLHSQHHRVSGAQATLVTPPTQTPLAPFTSSPARRFLQSTPALHIGVAMMPPLNVNIARAQQAAVVDQARGFDWTTTSGPLMAAAVTTTRPVFPVYVGGGDVNSLNHITPNIAATTITGLGIQLESVVTTTMTPATAIATTPLALTTMRPTGKQGKQITLTRGRKLLPHEQLRNYIEDAYIRMPLAVIVDPSSDALDKTKALWREALRTNLNIKIVLVSLNASGIPAAYNFNNTRQFLAGLNSIKVNDGGNSFVGILHASELVPYDSAVFISTAAIPPHTELVQDAAITLLKKRIRLYLIWYGGRSLSENETQEAVGGILGEVAIRSGGEVLHLVGSENSQELEGSTLTIVADAYVGTQEVDIPVDTTLSSLHVKIDAPMRTAILETPNGDINLKKLVKFKSLVLTHGPDDHRLDAYVPLNKLRKATVYKLKMIPESLNDEYAVFVRAERKSDLFLDGLIKHFESFLMHSRGSYPLRLNDIRLNSLPDAINGRALNTQETHSNIRFPDNGEIDVEPPITHSTSDQIPKDEVETFSETEIHNNEASIPTNQTTYSSSNAVVNINTNFKSMPRAATTTLLQRDVTKIEIGLQSQLLLAPGMLGTLQFELTNTRTDAIYHNIQVVDERRFLLRLNPQSIFLRAGEMATVAVTVLIPNGTPQGTIDKITFTCHGDGTSSLSLNLKVLSATSSIDLQDTTAPTVSWSFGSRCESVNADSSNCAERFWTLDITAQDWQTGIMRLQTIPTGGLVYRNSYTVGSTEPLKATYIATCCEPKVAITAFDVAGNQRSYNVDVRDLVLTEASIAAIVLGTLLLLLLIILLIWGIVWCCRRRQVSLDLPTYRSHSTRSMQ